VTGGPGVPVVFLVQYTSGSLGSAFIYSLNKLRDNAWGDFQKENHVDVVTATVPWLWECCLMRVLSYVQGDFSNF
jgi:hypothetical protein